MSQTQANSLTRHLLILDIDESLVHSADNPLDPNFDFRLSSYQVVKRPFLDEFMVNIFRWFNIALWTAATEDYAQEMVQRIIPNSHQLKFMWSRQRCTLKRDCDKDDYYWIKDLKKVKRLGYNLDMVLVIEDEPRSMQRSYGNIIIIRPFDGDPRDEELQILTQYLEWIRKVENVREIEKRNWRNFVK